MPARKSKANAKMAGASPATGNAKSTTSAKTSRSNRATAESDTTTVKNANAKVSPSMGNHTEEMTTPRQANAIRQEHDRDETSQETLSEGESQYSQSDQDSSEDEAREERRLSPQPSPTPTRTHDNTVVQTAKVPAKERIKRITAGYKEQDMRRKQQQDEFKNMSEVIDFWARIHDGETKGNNMTRAPWRHKNTVFNKDICRAAVQKLNIAIDNADFKAYNPKQGPVQKAMEDTAKAHHMQEDSMYMLPPIDEKQSSWKLYTEFQAKLGMLLGTMQEASKTLEYVENQRTNQMLNNIAIWPHMPTMAHMYRVYIQHS